MSKYEKILENQNEELLKNLEKAHSDIRSMEDGYTLYAFIKNWIKTRENITLKNGVRLSQNVKDDLTLTINSGRQSGQSTALIRIFMLYPEAILFTTQRRLIIDLAKLYNHPLDASKQNRIVQVPCNIIEKTRGMSISIILCDNYSEWSKLFPQDIPDEIFFCSLFPPPIIKVG